MHICIYNIYMESRYSRELYLFDDNFCSDSINVHAIYVLDTRINEKKKK